MTKIISKYVQKHEEMDENTKEIYDEGLKAMKIIDEALSINGISLSSGITAMINILGMEMADLTKAHLDSVLDAITRVYFLSGGKDDKEKI